VKETPIDLFVSLFWVTRGVLEDSSYFFIIWVVAAIIVVERRWISAP